MLTRYAPDRSTETFIYDGLGRIVASTDLNGGTTSFFFDDAAAQTKTVVTLANGLTRTSTYNKAGELISHIDAGDYVTGGTATYQYDQNGRLRVQTDASGNNSYFLYDRIGRKVADVGADGSLVEYRYDANDRVIARTRYYSQISSLSLVADAGTYVDMASIRPALTGAEEWAWMVYDSEGRILEAIEGDGAVTGYEYDASDRLVRTVGYPPLARRLFKECAAGDAIGAGHYRSVAELYFKLNARASNGEDHAR